MKNLLVDKTLSKGVNVTVDPPYTSPFSLDIALTIFGMAVDQDRTTTINFALSQNLSNLVVENIKLSRRAGSDFFPYYVIIHQNGMVHPWILSNTVSALQALRL